MKARICWLASWLAVLAFGLAAQSVADVARKSKEQSKDKKAKVVITDQQLKPSKPAPAKPAGDAGATGESGAGGEAVPPEGATPAGTPLKSVEEEATDFYRGQLETCQKKLEQQVADFERTFSEALKKAQPPPGTPRSCTAAGCSGRRTSRTTTSSCRSWRPKSCGRSGNSWSCRRRRARPGHPER